MNHYRIHEFQHEGASLIAPAQQVIELKLVGGRPPGSASLLGAAQGTGMGMKSPGGGHGQLKEKNEKTNDDYVYELGQFEVRRKRWSYLSPSYISSVAAKKRWFRRYSAKSPC